MKPAERTILDATPRGGVRVNLTFPVTRLGFGMFQFDALTQALGMPLSEILAPLMIAPMRQRPSAAGPAVDVYPLALPDGEGITMNLAHLGPVGFRADRGWLVLTVPLPFMGWAQQRLGHVIVHGPEITLSPDGATRVADLWIQLVPGMRSVLPLGVLGELGIEAA